MCVCVCVCVQGDNSPCVNNWTFFEEIDKYWRPASNTASLYQQLASRKYREVIRKQIQLVYESNYVCVHSVMV